MRKDDYIGASISTRIYEKNLLTRTELERLNDFDSLKDILAQLNDSIYRDPIESLVRPEEYEKILKAELKRVYELIEDFSPDENILKYMREKYHFHNLKLIVKEVIQDKDYKELYLDMGELDLAFIKKNLIKEDHKDKPFISVDDLNLKNEEKVKKDEEVYLDFAKKAIEIFEKTKDPQDIDLYLDKVNYQMKLEDAKNLGLEELIDFTREDIDLINLKTLLRVKSQDESIDLLEESLIEGGFIEEDKFKEYFSMDLPRLKASLAKSRISKYVDGLLKESRDLDDIILDLEKAIDAHMTDFTIDAKIVTFGPEVLLNFLISKEIEIKNLRILFVSKMNGLDRDLTLERLRKSYV
ncbi:MAG: V-type ATPase subunit [Anaerococcus sp.]|nr:V-type ATPase subunit [Anaerococcus sp.]